MRSLGSSTGKIRPGRNGIGRSLALIAVLGALATMAVFVSEAISLRRTLLTEREAALRSEVQIVFNLVKAIGDQEAAGALTREAAQARAKSLIRAVRYGQGDYFFSYDFNGVSVAHGSKPELEGKPLLDATDPNGVRYNALLIEGARHGGAFVHFAFPRAGQTVPAPKLGFSLAYEPWQWTIGSGVYVDDVDTVFRGRLLQGAAICALALLVLAAASWREVRRIVPPLRRVTAAMRGVAAGDLDTECGDETATGPGEIGELAAAVRAFRDSERERRRLAQDAAEQRLEADAERARREAERAAAAAAQEAVVSAVGTALEAVSSGDLTVRLPHPFAAQYEALRTNFNAALGQLHDLASGIADNAAGIHNAVTEIAGAADDLSARTERQAASLEETAAALEQITVTVRRTAEGAKAAGQAVADAREEADKSGAVVRDAVTAIGEIERSSQQISQIIGVIDEIAFQTNLLALNAGVEAARAGEAGRGFAVVASEVRALAQRSAQAAKEIKALISTSGAQVGRGVGLVGETGRALDRIVQQVAAISAVVTEIAHSTQQQASGLAEINGAVGDMDKVTQQNAAMVEQTTAAAHATVGDADRLAGLVRRFRLAAPAPNRPKLAAVR